MGLYAKSRDRDRWRLWPCLLLCLLVAACSRDDDARTVETLRIAVLPDQSDAKLRTKYQPLLDYIETHTSLHCELLIPESYDQLLQWFIDRQIDMARVGGVAYVKAHLQARAAAHEMTRPPWLPGARCSGVVWYSVPPFTLSERVVLYLPWPGELASATVFHWGSSGSL